MKLLAASAALLLVASAAADNHRPPQPRVIPTIPSRPATRQVPQAKPALKLEENVTIQLKGNIHGMAPLDIALTGTGPRFQTDTLIPSKTDGAPGTLIRVTLTVVPREDERFNIEYTVSARVAVASTVTNANKVSSTSYQFQEVTQIGSVILTLDKATAISVMNGEAMTLQVSATE